MCFKKTYTVGLRSIGLVCGTPMSNLEHSFSPYLNPCFWLIQIQITRIYCLLREKGGIGKQWCSVTGLYQCRCRPTAMYIVQLYM